MHYFNDYIYCEIIDPATGKVLPDGEQGEIVITTFRKEAAPLIRYRTRVGMVFQQYSLFANKTALQNITEPLIRVKKMRKEEARQKAREVLKLVGLEDKEDAYPSHLSGGQQQRVGIGRAIATGPKLMLLDEPTSSLDPELVGGVLEVIRKLAARHMTMLLTTHEMDFARSVADQVIFLADGRIQEEGTPAEIFDHPQNPRLQSFLASHFRRELS